MEDDDEFGDLYTDVLQSFTSSLSSAPQTQQPSSAPSSTHRAIDLNLKTDDEDDETICGATYSNSAPPQNIDQHVSSQSVGNVQDSKPVASSDSTRVLIDRAEESLVKHEGDSAGGVRLVDGRVVELPKRVLGDVNCGSEFSDVDGNRRDDVVKDVNLEDKDVKFDIEEDNYGTDDMVSEPIIPGLSSAGYGDGDDNHDARALVPGLGMNSDASGRYVLNDADRGEGDDWDSDSEDDLQILLNENNHGHLAVERGTALGEGVDEDEDADGLVIVANGDSNQGVEEQQWGEDATRAADVKTKETNEAGKAGIVSAVASKSVYSGYHQYHSQFKYVRPGATPIPGANTSAPGGPVSQVRPMVNMGLVSVRGRGDWRPVAMKNAPPGHKGFYSGAGPPSWNAGRVFGGVEFTLPSHKTIFDVDIDGFEEKPWKHPGAESSDFFNFSLNEESWKEYCKQLEQLRLESTMQSKIRVYESGRTEQEYDPDMPPELVAAAGIHDVALENPHPVKPDDGQNDVARGLTTRVRPPMPTGRAIQVENGSGERLPSIDTRPPRIRDSDAIIEIALQDSADDDSSTAAGMQEHLGNEIPREELGDEDDVNQDGSDYYDSYAKAYDGLETEKTERKRPDMNAAPNGIAERGFIKEEKAHSRSRSNTPDYSGGKHGSAYGERELPERLHDRSPDSTSSKDLKVDDNLNEESVENLQGIQEAPVSPFTDREALDSILDPVKADGSSSVNKEQMPSNTAEKSAAFKDGVKSQKLISHVEQSQVQELDDGEDSKAARNSDNSRARSGSSRDYQKRKEGFDEEVIQDLESDRVSSIRRHLDESEYVSRRRGLDENQQLERNQPVKARNDFYPYREWDPTLGRQLHRKPDEFERQKDRDNPDGGWLQRDDDPYGRRNRTEDNRKRGRAEEIGSIRRAKPRDKNDSLLSRKQLDNGGYRVQHEKDVGSRDSRHRVRENVLKSRHENVEDYQKKRKDEEYYRREYMEKEEIYREQAIRRRKERDEVVDQRKRDDQMRTRDSIDDHYTSRHKEDSWIQKDRVDRVRDKLKSPEENPPRRERDEGRGSVRSERGVEEKTWAVQSREKTELRVSEKEHQFKDTVRRSDQSKKRDRADDDNSHHRGHDDAYSRVNTEEKRSRQGKLGIRNDHAAIASDNQKIDKKSKDGTRKNKELGATHSSMVPSRRNQGDQMGQSSDMGLIGSSGHNEHEVAVHSLAKRHRRDVSSDEERQDSRRGRSKLERWTSHKERDFSIASKSSSSMKLKEIDGNNTGVSSESGKSAKESVKTTGVSENQHSERKDAGDIESKDAETKPLVDRHLDTVEKLKKRSERFKLPLPSEKEASTIKKLESEPLPSSTKNENPVESEVKQDRPPRKRRWISN